jgi:hypothetical protein
MYALPASAAVPAELRHAAQENPIKGWLMRHKRLAHVISLKRSKTTLSMFCFTDLAFALTAEPARADVKAGLLHLDREGSSVFVFKHRSRTRSTDWYWELWYGYSPCL